MSNSEEGRACVWPGPASNPGRKGRRWGGELLVSTQQTDRLACAFTPQLGLPTNQLTNQLLRSLAVPCSQAPVPYLNRAISKEALGVEAAASGDRAAALQLWRSAAADCDRAIELDGREFAAWFDRGNIQMRLEDYPAALTDFSTAADLAPGLAGGPRRGLHVYGLDCAQHMLGWLLMMGQAGSGMQRMRQPPDNAWTALPAWTSRHTAAACHHCCHCYWLPLLQATACARPP